MIGEHEGFLRGGEVTCLSGEFVGSEFPEGFAAIVAEADADADKEKQNEKWEEQEAEKEEA